MTNFFTSLEFYLVKDQRNKFLWPSSNIHEVYPNNFTSIREVKDNEISREIARVNT